MVAARLYLALHQYKEPAAKKHPSMLIVLAEPLAVAAVLLAMATALDYLVGSAACLLAFLADLTFAVLTAVALLFLVDS